MNTPKNDLRIKCPHCGNKFAAGDALEHELQLRLQQEIDKQMEVKTRSIEKQQKEKYEARLVVLEKERDAQATRAGELEESAVAFEEREEKLKSREAQLDLELRKKLLEKTKLIQKEAEKTALAKADVHVKERERELARQREAMDIAVRKAAGEAAEKAREEERMKAADLQKKLDDQAALINTMKRRAEQGSMQAQGEVQELAIEDYLAKTFPADQVEEIAKGKRGGDCVQHVRDGLGVTVGKILYESKRTKNFGGDWAQKLRDDMRLTSADLGVIVTEVLPCEMTRFGMHDGVWVCTFGEFKALAYILRDSLIRVGEARAVKENRGSKMQSLYDYLTSNEFRQKLEAMVEAFQAMQDDLAKERKHMLAHWSKREKQIYKVMENTVSLYGDIRGIAGTAVKEIAALEIEEVRRLTE